MAAGELRDPIHFQRRGNTANDPDGVAVGDFAPLFSRMARVQARNAGGANGDEANVGMRLEGRQAYEIKVRNDPQTRTLTNTDRIEVEVGPYAGFYNIRTLAPFRPDPQYLLITAERGGPDG